MRPELRSLTGLRGIAALWVLGFHTMVVLQRLGSPLAIPVGVFGRAGYLGVDLFFVLSGFVIAYNYAGTPRWTPATYGSFLWKRLARIYPVHLAGLALFAIFVAYAPADTKIGSRTLSGLFSSVALIHAWAVPVRGTWNHVSWSVSLEWAAYIAFPIVAVVAMRLRSSGVILASVVGLFLVLWLLVSSVPLSGTMAYGVFRIAAEFTSGALLFRLWSLKQESMPRIWASAALLALIFGGSALESTIGKDTAFIYLPILAAAAVYSLACAPAMLSGALVQHLGKISYSLYIVHVVVLRFARVTIRSYGLDAAWVLGGTLAAIALAHLVYRYLEQPARAWMLKLGERALQRRVALTEPARVTASIESK